MAPTHGWRVYAGLYTGQLWRSTTSASQLPTRRGRLDTGRRRAASGCHQLHRGAPHRPSQALGGLLRFIDKTVWYSENEGASWQPRSTGLPAREPVKVIKVDPDAPAKLWLGTDTGVYVLSTAVSSGRSAGDLPPAPVFDLEIDRHTKRVFAATHGRGVSC